MTHHAISRAAHASRRRGPAESRARLGRARERRRGSHSTRPIDDGDPPHRERALPAEPDVVRERHGHRRRDGGERDHERHVDARDRPDAGRQVALDERGQQDVARRDRHAEHRRPEERRPHRPGDPQEDPREQEDERAAQRPLDPDPPGERPGQRRRDRRTPAPAASSAARRRRSTARGPRGCRTTTGPTTVIDARRLIETSTMPADDEDRPRWRRGARPTQDATASCGLRLTRRARRDRRRTS